MRKNFNPKGLPSILVTLTTYGTETATTNWQYSSDRGFLTRKEYQGGNGTDYDYTAAGRLHKRT